MSILKDKILKWDIYKIVNPFGKVYIGMSSRFPKRINYYKNYECTNQPLLFRSLKKYGFENHIISIIESFESNIDYAHGKEMFWIRSFMSNNCKWRDCNGLNLTDGGEGTVGYKATEDHKKRLSEIHKKNPNRAMLGKTHSDEAKQKLRIAYFKNPPPKRTPIYTDEQRAEKLIENREKQKIKNRTTNSKEETKQFQSLAKKGKPAYNKGKPMPAHQKEILRKINTGRPSKFKGVSRWSEEDKKKCGIKNIGNTYNKGRKQKPELVEARRLNLLGKPNVALYKPILQFTLDDVFIMEYDSIKKAAIEIGMSAGTISDIAKGGVKNPSKFRFKFKAA